MNKVLWKDVLREIRYSLPRFLSIIAIIMLGVAFFIGIRAAGPSMLETSQTFFEQHHMPHGWVQGTYGLNQEDIDTLQDQDASLDWLPMSTVQEFAHPGSQTLKVYPWSAQDNHNFFHVVAGRWPQASGEIVLDDKYQPNDKHKEVTYQIGDVVTFSQNNKDSRKASSPQLKQESYKIVGFVESPLYFERTNRGLGPEDGFAVVSAQDIDSDLFTEAYFWKRGLSNHDAFSQDWEDQLSQVSQNLEEALKDRPDRRLNEVKSTTLDDIDAKQAEIDQGYQDLEEAKLDLDQAEQDLSDHRIELDQAKDALDQGYQEIMDGQAEYGQGLIDAHEGRQALQEAQEEFDKRELEYLEGQEDYQVGMTEYEDMLAESLESLNKQQAEWDEQADLLQAKKTQLEEESKELDNQWLQIANQTGLSRDQLQSAVLDKTQYQEQRNQLLKNIDNLENQVESGQAQEDLVAQLAQLKSQKKRLEQRIAQLSQDSTGTKSIADLRQELADVQEKIDQVTHTMRQTRPLKEIQDDLQVANDQLAQLDRQYQTMQGLLEQYGPQLQSLKDGQVQLDQAWSQYQTGKEKLDQSQVQLDQAWNQYRQQKNQLPDSLQDAKEELDAAKKQLDQGEADLKKGKEEAQEGDQALIQAFEDLEGARREWADSRDKYWQGQADWLDGKETYQEKRDDYQASYPDAIKDLEEGQKELNQARKDIRNLAVPQYKVTAMVDDDVYQGLANNAEQLNVIANIFPVFFLAIAVLVTYSTVKRMTQEQRNYMGTLKQLGYSDQAILFKFLVYAGMASSIGIIIGLIAGYQVFPPVVLAAYNIMYRFNAPVVHYSPIWMVITAIIAYLTAFIPAYFSPKKILNDAPVNLLRPQAPRSGHTTFVEKIRFIWRRLSFKRKMTVRNLLRYKGRNLMTLFGVAGCTMLIVTGFGISDTISGIVSQQFDHIHTYDAILVMDDDADQSDCQNINNLLESESQVQGVVSVSQHELETNLKGSQNQTVTALVPIPADQANFEKYFHLNERDDPQTRLRIPQGQIILTERLEEFVHSRDRETVPFSYDGRESELKVKAVTENYVDHYVYMNPEDFQKHFNKKPEINTFYLDYKGKPSQDLLDKLANQKGVLTILNIDDMTAGLKSSLGSLDLITLVLVISAAGLAFVVLYNLTNINIAERLKELATIKVLGFYSTEVSLYIYDEILILTLFGSVIGLGLGYRLTHFIMKTMQLNNVLFYPRVHLASYGYSLALTFLFSGIVMIVMHRKIRQIDMVEALKAVD